MNWKVHKEDVLNRINNCAISKKSKISSRSELYYNPFLFFFYVCCNASYRDKNKCWL